VGGGDVLAIQAKLITAHDLAAALDLSVDTIWRYTREEKIPCIRLSGNQYRYRLDEVVKALRSESARESRVDYGSEEGKRLTYNDYCTLPAETGYRLELFDGMLIREPSPKVAHQRVIPPLWKILETYFKIVDPGGEVFLAPLDVTLDQYNVVQPDLFYIPGDQMDIVEADKIAGAPELIVEVISTTSARKDRIIKMQLYQDAGVLHYFLVDTAAKTLECYFLHEGHYSRIAGGMDNDVVEYPQLEGLKIELGLLWKVQSDQ
jgi:Uma2 family endonuclease